MFFQHYEQIGRFVFYETLPLACLISSDTRPNIKKVYTRILHCKLDESTPDDNAKESASCHKYFWMEIEVTTFNH